MINRRHILHRFKLRQNAQIDNLFIFNILSSSNFQNIISNCGRMHSKRPRFKTFLRPPTPNHFPISRKLYFAHAMPLVTDFARMQPRRLKLPNILDSNKFPCHNMIKIMNSKKVLYVYK